AEGASAVTQPQNPTELHTRRKPTVHPDTSPHRQKTGTSAPGWRIIHLYVTMLTIQSFVRLPQ
ncbi:hypothetical protein, partial [Marinimicrobium sp. UBA4509]|uniref:hypothetical protein n=1 Tax=Marinimicrobium sp. UBA4509 TaxID=1946811 RepID=UPI00257FBCC0